MVTLGKFFFVGPAADMELEGLDRGESSSILGLRSDDSRPIQLTPPVEPLQASEYVEEPIACPVASDPKCE